MSNDDGRAGLLHELRRRKVFRVAAAYAAAAFIILQATDLLAAGLSLPGWVFPAITIMVVLGLPVAIVLAWAYELTPAGMRREEPVSFRELARPGWRRLAAAAGVGLVVFGAGGWWAARSLFASDETLRALAVLPFEDLSAADDATYFSAGVHAEIVAQLSQLSELRLMSPAAIAAVGEGSDRLARLAAELGVGSVLEGSVRVAGDRARVAVRLTDARSGRSIWAEQYDAELADVLQVQSDVALRIARALHARLSPGERQRIETPPTRDPVAYDLYLRGRDGWGPNMERLVAASELFRQAARLDPDFAMAHARLAFVLNRRADYFGEPGARDSALAAVARAIAADSSLAFAYHTLGAIRYGENRFGAARRAFARSLELDPNQTGSMNDMGLTLAVLGQYDEALHWAEQALRRGPNLANNYYHTGLALLFLGDDAATERFLLEGLTKTPPDAARVHYTLALLEAFTGRVDEAMQRMRTLVARLPTNMEVRIIHSEVAQFARAPEADSLVEALYHLNPDHEGWTLAVTARTNYARVLLARGDTARANRLLAESLEKTLQWIRDEHEAPHVFVELAAVHTLLGDRAAAVDALHGAYFAGYREYHSLRLHPALEPLTDEPAFLDVLARIAEDIARMRRRAAAASDLL